MFQSNANNTPIHATTVMDNQWLVTLNQYILENIAKTDLDNADIAEALGISESTLHRKILRLTQLSPLKYIRQFKIEKAYELLYSEHFTHIKDIANEVGFQNVHYFTTLFEAHYGIRPINILREM